MSEFARSPHPSRTFCPRRLPLECKMHTVAIQDWTACFPGQRECWWVIVLVIALGTTPQCVDAAVLVLAPSARLLLPSCLLAPLAAHSILRAQPPPSLPDHAPLKLASVALNPEWSRTHSDTASLSMRFMFPPTKKEQQYQSCAAICEMNCTCLEHASLLLCCGVMRVVV